MAREGADIKTLQGIAGQMGTLGDEVVTGTNRLDVAIDSMAWRGVDADNFKQQWSSIRSALSSAAAHLGDAKSRLTFEMSQQQTASDDTPVFGQSAAAKVVAASAASGGILGLGGTTTSGITSVTRNAEQVSTNDGWLLGPLVAGASPALGGAMTADSELRMAQDIKNGNYAQGLQEGSGLVASQLYAGEKDDPVLGLAGADVQIWSDAASALHAINVPYTLGHLSELNIAAPGALQAVGQAEAAGFENLAKQLTSGIIGGLFS